jgi:hypothetical protein
MTNMHSVVMDASQPTEYHEKVLNLAKRWDISGDRTLRILTKFDLVPTFNLHALNAVRTSLGYKLKLKLANIDDSKC